MQEQRDPEPAGTAESPSPDSGRIWTMRGLVALGTILLTVGALAIWIERVALRTPAWTDTSGRVLANPAVQQSVSVYLVDQLYDNVDVARQLEAAFPGRAKPLAGPTAAALRDVLVQGAARVLATPQSQKIWRRANEQANRQLVRLLDNGRGSLQATNGALVLDLRPLVERVAGTSRIGGKLGPDAGKIVLLRSSQFQLAQDATRALRAIALLLVPLVGLVFALAIWVAPDRRRALRACALGVLVAGLALVILRRVLGTALIDRVVSDREFRPAAHRAWWIATEELRLMVASILFVGIVGVLGAWLAGPGTRALAIRRALAGFMQAGRVYVTLGSVILLLLVWAPTPAARNWVTVLVLSLVLALGLEALRRQTAREFPDALPGRISLPRSFSRAREAVPSTPENVRLDQLERLAELHRQGVLSDDELVHEKARVLATAP